MNIIAKMLRARRQQKLRERLVFEIRPFLKVEEISALVDFILDGAIPSEPPQSATGDFGQRKE